mmetsp:Transcript_42895/g.127124  ORF Transcript_42895/g.127124 Transcript_42895/m.127124 type:complete len:218 (-) Transcript_42895:1067-1720(-)
MHTSKPTPLHGRTRAAPALQCPPWSSTGRRPAHAELGVCPLEVARGGTEALDHLRTASWICAAVANFTPGHFVSLPSASDRARVRPGVPATKVCMPRHTTLPSPGSEASCRTWSSSACAYWRPSMFLVSTREKSFVSMQYGRQRIFAPLSWVMSNGTSSSTKSMRTLRPEAAAMPGVRSVTENWGVSHETGFSPVEPSRSFRTWAKAVSSSARLIWA